MCALCQSDEPSPYDHSFLRDYEQFRGCRPKFECMDGVDVAVAAVQLQSDTCTDVHKASNQLSNIAGIWGNLDLCISNTANIYISFTGAGRSRALYYWSKGQKSFVLPYWSFPTMTNLEASCVGIWATVPKSLIYLALSTIPNNFHT